MQKLKMDILLNWKLFTYIVNMISKKTDSQSTKRFKPGPEISGKTGQIRTSKRRMG